MKRDVEQGMLGVFWHNTVNKIKIDNIFSTPNIFNKFEFSLIYLSLKTLIQLIAFPNKSSRQTNCSYNLQSSKSCPIKYYSVFVFSFIFDVCFVNSIITLYR